jgi:hypothetical protein
MGRWGNAAGVPYPVAAGSGNVGAHRVGPQTRAKVFSRRCRQPAGAEATFSTKPAAAFFLSKLICPR